MKLMKVAAVALGMSLGVAAQAQQAGDFKPMSPQEVEKLRAQLGKLIEAQQASPAALNKQIGAPGTSFGNPTAYGAARGQGYVGVSGVYDHDGKGRVNGNGRLDGSMSAGVGFGDPVKAVGVEVSGNINSLNPKDGTLGDSGAFGVKMHRVLDLSSGTAVAFALTDAARWGDAKKAHRSNYAALTTNLPVKLVGNYALSATLGAGNGSYSPLSSAKKGESKVGAFVGLGTQLTERTSVSVSHVGGLTNIGVGLIPFDAPVSVSVGITDVSNKSVAGKALNINLGYAFTY